MGNMNDQTQFLTDIEHFISTAGISESTFGFKAVNDGKFVKRIRHGGRMYRETEEKVRRYMRTHSPTTTTQEERRV